MISQVLWLLLPFIFAHPDTFNFFYGYDSSHPLQLPGNPTDMQEQLQGRLPFSVLMESPRLYPVPRPLRDLLGHFTLMVSREDLTCLLLLSTLPLPSVGSPMCWSQYSKTPCLQAGNAKSEWGQDFWVDIAALQSWPLECRREGVGPQWYCQVWPRTVTFGSWNCVKRSYVALLHPLHR